MLAGMETEGLIHKNPDGRYSIAESGKREMEFHKKKCGIGTLVLAVLIVAIIIIGSDLLRTAIGVLLEVIILALIDLY